MSALDLTPRERAQRTAERGLTGPQRSLLAILDAARDRKGAPFGLDCDELAERLGTSRHGAAATASSLVRKGLAVRFVSHLGGRRAVCFQAAS